MTKSHLVNPKFGQYGSYESEEEIENYLRIKSHTGKELGGSPGLVVMGGDSLSKGHEFESRHHILFLVFERTKINKKRPGMVHFFKIQAKMIGREI